MEVSRITSDTRDRVDLTVSRQDIHALGGKRSGKSTLIKILAGC
jgi:ABC-type sugar transport system ATPase subunit